MSMDLLLLLRSRCRFAWGMVCRGGPADAALCSEPTVWDASCVCAAASRIFLRVAAPVRGRRSAHYVGTADLRSAPWPRVQGLDLGWPV